MIQEAELQNGILGNLASFIKTAFVNDSTSGALHEQWLKDKIDEFYNKDKESEELKDGNMLDVFEMYIDIYNMAES